MAQLANPEDIKKATAVLDIRPEAERNSSPCIAGALCLEWDREGGKFVPDEATIEKTLPAKDAAIAVHCKTGGRVSMALGVLKSLGYTNVMNAGGPNGGEEQWQALQTLAK